jgi:hypothetical protein
MLITYNVYLLNIFVLFSLRILPLHAVIVNDGKSLTIMKCGRNADVHVNGQRLEKPIELQHLVSGVHVFIL